jgi:hypothetical protein
MPAHGKKKRPSSPGLLHSNASACAGSSRCRAPSRRACDASCCCLPAQFASETPNLPSSGAVLLIASPAFSPPRRPPVTTPTNNARPHQLLAHTDFANSPHSPAASARPLTERARSPRDLPQPRRPVAVHWVSLSARPVPHNHRPQRALPQPLRSRRRRSPPAAPIAGLVLVLAVTSRRPPVHAVGPLACGASKHTKTSSPTALRISLDGAPPGTSQPNAVQAASLPLPALSISTRPRLAVSRSRLDVGSTISPELAPGDGPYLRRAREPRA